MIKTSKMELNKNSSLIKLGETELLTEESLMLVKGESGSGKGRLLMNMIIGLLGGDDNLGLSYEVCPPNKKIIYINTEMNHNDLIRRLRSIEREVPNGMMDRLKMWDSSHSEDIVSYMDIGVSNEFPHVIIFDQIGDVLEDINSIVESKKVVTHFLKYSKEYHCGLIAVMHQNEDSGIDTKARGHLGSYLEQKVCSSIAIKKSYDKYKIKSTKIREGEPILFTADFNKATSCLIKTEEKNLKEYLMTLNYPMRSSELKELCMAYMERGSTTIDKKLSELIKEEFLIRSGASYNQFYNIQK